jgi:apolipoprotein D and lipocalin family protein
VNLKPLLLLSALAFPLLAADPPVVAKVDLARYMGTWHEIAKFPNRFQKGCTCTTATYSLKPNGKVRVVNRCGTEDGKGKQSSGWAKVVDPVTNARLKVTFFWPFFGDYWILDLDPGYRRVLVGTPNRKYLWILAREPRLEAGDYQELVAKAARMGYPVERLVMTPACP